MSERETKHSSERDPSQSPLPVPGPSSTAESEGSAIDPELTAAIEHLRRGRNHDDSFRLVFDHFYPPVQRFLSKRVFSPEDRLDLTQEIFLRIYKGVEGFRGDSQFGTWVFRIAYTTYLKWLRKARNEEARDSALAAAESESAVWEDETPAVVDPAPTPLDRTLDDERKLQLQRAIEKLPEKMQQCTRLRIYQDLSYREIAVTMKLSIETVKVHLFQARKKLRNLLQDIDF